MRGVQDVSTVFCLYRLALTVTQAQLVLSLEFPYLLNEGKSGEHFLVHQEEEYNLCSDPETQQFRDRIE